MRLFAAFYLFLLLFNQVAILRESHHAHRLCSEHGDWMETESETNFSPSADTAAIGKANVIFSEHSHCRILPSVQTVSDRNHFESILLGFEPGIFQSAAWGLPLKDGQYLFQLFPKTSPPSA